MAEKFLISYIDGKDGKGRFQQGVSIGSVIHLDFDGLWPVRRPVSYKGQLNYPGYYWFAQLNKMIPYESRLEMTILMKLDFETQVRHVLEQPLLFQFNVGDETYKHVPDFLVTYNNGSRELIDVKPKKYVDKERNRRAFTASE
jgi:TnsA endonuclease N terminal